MWKKAIVACFIVLSLNFIGATGKMTETPQDNRHLVESVFLLAGAYEYEAEMLQLQLQLRCLAVAMSYLLCLSKGSSLYHVVSCSFHALFCDVHKTGKNEEMMFHNPK
jgi:hypothetical protein